jgi:hypothetical protein
VHIYTYIYLFYTYADTHCLVGYTMGQSGFDERATLRSDYLKSSSVGRIQGFYQHFENKWGR